MRHAPTIWEEGRTPGRRVVTLGVALVLTVAVVDLLIAEELDWIFDVGFVVVSALLALLVHPRDLFTVGVLPPLLMLGLCVLLAITRPEAIAAADDGPVQATVSGLGHHSIGLFAGYALCLAVLETRRRVGSRRVTQRPAAPAPPEEVASSA